jgi:NADPH:quinone reductase
MRAIVVDSSAPHRLGLGHVPDIDPLPHEVLVRVEAISLNQGEVRRALTDDPDGWVPGWDFAGIVERAASQGGGPLIGERVVGFLTEGAWRERIATPARNLAVLPQNMSTTSAASLPVAGLTALFALAEGQLLTGKTVLVNGASGGVGHFALQLARAAGASVVAAVRRETQRINAEADGAHRVLVSEDLHELRTEGAFDLILESAGGAALGNALHALASGGTCVSYGNSSRLPTTFEPLAFFYPQGRTRLAGFYLLANLEREPPTEGLSKLVHLLDIGVLRPRIEVETSWAEIDVVVERYMRREITGKIVLQVD